MTEPIVPAKTYIHTFIGLIVLTVLTAAAANLDMGPANTVVALVIASCKATLVVWYFMHVRYSTPLIRLAIAAGLLWLCIMAGMTLGDYMTRGWLPPPKGL